MKKIIALLVMLLISFSVYAQPGGTPPGGTPPGGSGGGSSSLPTTYSGAYTLNGGSAVLANQTISASSQDQSGVYVYNGGQLVMTRSQITTTGNTSSGDNSSFYGLNAGVLALSSGSISLSGSKVTTSGTGSNGVFAYGAAVITLASDTIYCSGQLGHAIMASGGGTLSATNVVMTTTNTNSGAIATDRGGGTLNVRGGSVLTTGKDSPGIYSTGMITVTNTPISATGSEGAVIEGLNTVTLDSVSLSGGVDAYGGVMIYQSMSGDAETGTGTFIMRHGSLAATRGALFFITNTHAKAVLSEVTVTPSATGVLINAAATTRWGNSGSNGGHLDFAASAQTLTGNILVDAISTAAIALQNGSVLTGAVDAAHTAQSLSLTLDATSSWNVTGTSYVTRLVESAGTASSTLTNINSNGYTIYYRPDSCAWLGGATIALTGGGKLSPLTTGIDDKSGALPAELGLQQNYPNPFNPVTTIAYQLPAAGRVSLKVFDLRGREVATLVEGEAPAGSYTTVWNGANAASGLYFCQLATAQGLLTRRMLLVK